MGLKKDIGDVLKEFEKTGVKKFVLFSSEDRDEALDNYLIFKSEEQGIIFSIPNFTQSIIDYDFLFYIAFRDDDIVFIDGFYYILGCEA